MYGADATRVALADAGDSLDDANFVLPNADNAVLKLSNLFKWITKTLQELENYREGVSDDAQLDFADKFFNANIDNNLYMTYQAFK